LVQDHLVGGAMQRPPAQALQTQSVSPYVQTAFIVVQTSIWF
jgi:hypothetical protein